MSKQEQNNGYVKKGVRGRREEERMAYKAERYAKRHEGQAAYEGRRDRKSEPEDKVRRAAADRRAVS